MNKTSNGGKSQPMLMGDGWLIVLPKWKRIYVDQRSDYTHQHSATSSGSSASCHSKKGEANQSTQSISLPQVEPVILIDTAQPAAVRRLLVVPKKRRRINQHRATAACIKWKRCWSNCSGSVGAVYTLLFQWILVVSY